MIKAVKFVSIPVSDQDRSLAFYKDKLGFTVMTDQPFDDKQRWIELRIPGADTRIVLFTMHGHEDRVGTVQNVTFVADDVEATYRELRERDVEFTGEPQGAEWGKWACFRDPDGNQFVLASK